MILPFSTKLDGKETNFVSKIWTGLLKNNLAVYEDIEAFENAYLFKTFNDLEIDITASPKIHTLRDDENDRWKRGIMIDFFINVRTKSMFRFAPKVQVISTQKINIIYKNKLPVVFIDRIQFYNTNIKYDIPRMLLLAQNDGFDTIEDFFNYFNKDYTGKIIHWTDLRY